MHSDGGRSERISGWKEERTPVLAVMIWCLGRAGKNVMPFENVGFGRVSGNERGWVCLNRLVFTGKL